MSTYAGGVGYLNRGPVRAVLALAILASTAAQPTFADELVVDNSASGVQLKGTWAASTNGTGSDSTVDYNPDQWPDPSTRTKAPGDVILFHELTHADHNSRGTNAQSTTRADNFDNDEEFNTIGPENEYRDERRVPRRTDHHDL